MNEEENNSLWNAKNRTSSRGVPCPSRAPGMPKSPPYDDEATEIPRHLRSASFVTNVDEANESLHDWLDRLFLSKMDTLVLEEEVARLLVDLITGKIPPSDPP